MCAAGSARPPIRHSEEKYETAFSRLRAPPFAGRPNRHIADRGGAGGIDRCLGRYGFGYPGIIQGVITFTAPFVPTSITVDARDSSNLYTAQATAAQNGPSCAAGSPNWCYSIVVESALANAYYLRPIAVCQPEFAGIHRQQRAVSAHAAGVHHAERNRYV